MKVLCNLEAYNEPGDLLKSGMIKHFYKISTITAKGETSISSQPPLTMLRKGSMDHLTGKCKAFLASYLPCLTT